MNKKIKVMDQKPEASDEEIKSYMNFQSLMEKHGDTMSMSRRSSILKKSIGGLTIVAVVISAVWFFQREEITNAQQPEKKEPVVAFPAPENQHSLDSTTTNQTQVVSKEPIQPEVIKKESSSVTSKEAPKLDLKKETDAEESYVQAEPVKGYPDLYDYFNRNLIYPKEAMKDSVQGVLTIAFVVGKNGRPEKIEIVNSMGEAFDREARRLIENMPDWKPAILNGKPVPSKMSLPVTFQIQKVKTK